jgi:thiol-disulfide isomerase/thioredoxin
MKSPRIIALLAACISGLLFATVAQAEDIKPQRIAFGEEVDIHDYLVAGKTVIFDFTSRFCGPCEAIAPYLHKLNASRDDIVVVEVDINRKDFRGIDWRSPVATQYGMNSVPFFKVYGPDKKLVAEGDEARELVIGWLQD